MKMKVKAFFLGLVGSFAFFFIVNVAQQKLENVIYADISRPIENIAFVQRMADPSADLEIFAKAALSYKLSESGREKIVFKKNISEKHAIASVSKLMTAVVVLEDKENYPLTLPVQISYESSNQEDVPVFGNLRKGDSYTVRRLLELMLRYSSNDAAFALAEVIGVEKFTDKMNQKAQELQLQNTFFYNSSGLDISDQESNYSNAKDLLNLCVYIQKNHSEIFEITSQNGSLAVRNGLFDLKLWSGDRLVGGKTGYTPVAGGCMVVLVEDQKRNTFVNIVLGAESAEDRIFEMQKLINFCHNNL